MAELLVSVFDFAEDIIGVGLEILDSYNVESQTRRLGRQALKKVPKERRFEFLGNSPFNGKCLQVGLARRINKRGSQKT